MFRYNLLFLLIFALHYILEINHSNVLFCFRVQENQWTTLCATYDEIFGDLDRLNHTNVFLILFCGISPGFFKKSLRRTWGFRKVIQRWISASNKQQSIFLTAINRHQGHLIRHLPAFGNLILKSPRTKVTNPNSHKLTVIFPFQLCNNFPTTLHLGQHFTTFQVHNCNLMLIIHPRTCRVPTVGWDSHCHNTLGNRGFDLIDVLAIPVDA